MGGGSSNDEKTNEINKKVAQQLQKQMFNQDNLQNPIQKPNSKLNSPKVSPKNSPRSPNNSILIKPQQNNLRNSKLNSNRQSKNNSALNKGNQKPLNIQDTINESQTKRPTKENTQILKNIELSKKSQYKVGIYLLKLAPTKNITPQTKIQQTESTYDATLTWQFDQKTKKWNFTLQKPQSTELNFVISQRGQVIKGEQEKWQFFNPSFGDTPRAQSRYYMEQIVAESLERDNFWKPSLDQLTVKKKFLCEQWNEEYNERVVEFLPVKNYERNDDSHKIDNKYEPYHEIRKFFKKENDDWHLTLDIVENDYKFHAFFTWKILNKDQNLTELIQKQKRILELKKQIYVHKMKILSGRE